MDEGLFALVSEERFRSRALELEHEFCEGQLGE